MLIAFNSLVTTPALEKQALDWIRTLVHEEKYFQSGKQKFRFQVSNGMRYSNAYFKIRLSNIHQKTNPLIARPLSGSPNVPDIAAGIVGSIFNILIMTRCGPDSNPTLPRHQTGTLSFELMPIVC